jgi:hypothetical protein
LKPLSSNPLPAFRASRRASLCLAGVLGVSSLTAGCGAPSGSEVAEHRPADPSAAIQGVNLSATDGEEFDPARAGTIFASGTRGVAARYRFANAAAGTRIELRWTHQGEPIFGQQEELREPSGTSTWVLRMGRGSPLPDGSYALEIEEDGEPVIRLPFSVGPPPGGRAAAPTAAGAPGGATIGSGAAAQAPMDTGGTARSGILPERAGPAGPARAGNEPGEGVAGLVYRNESARLSFSVPSYAWRFDLAPAREPESAVVAGRFSPSGTGLALLRVRVFPESGPLQRWAAERQAEAGKGRELVKSERREIGGRAFVQFESRAGATRAAAAYTVEGGRGYAFEFLSPERNFAALEDEFQQVLGSARFW